MLQKIYKLFGWLIFRLRFPSISVAYGSFSTGEFSCGANTIIDRNVRLTNVKLGDGAIIRANAILHNAICAEHVVINANSIIDAVNIKRFSYIGPKGQFSQVDIGAFCSIGAECICGSGEHPIDYVSSHPVFFSRGRQCGITFAQKDCFEERSKIVIGNDVWIGTRVFIRDGVSIGDGAVIAAGAVVVSDIPPYAIAGGVPAKLIKYRFSEAEIEQLLEIKWWEWDERSLREAQTNIACNNMPGFLEKYSKRETL